jgi:hypothetical protein
MNLFVWLVKPNVRRLFFGPEQNQLITAIFSCANLMVVLFAYIISGRLAARMTQRAKESQVVQRTRLLITRFLLIHIVCRFCPPPPLPPSRSLFFFLSARSVSEHNAISCFCLRDEI